MIFINILINKPCSPKNNLITENNVERYIQSLGFKPNNHGILLVCVPFLHYVFQRLHIKLTQSTPDADKILTQSFLPSEQFLLAFQPNGILLISLKPLTLSNPNVDKHSNIESLDELWINGKNIFLPNTRIKSIKNKHGYKKLIIINNVFSSKALHKLTIKILKLRHLNYSKNNQSYIKDELKPYQPINKSFNKKSLKLNADANLSKIKNYLSDLVKSHKMPNTKSILSANFNTYTSNSYVPPRQKFGNIQQATKEKNPSIHTKLQHCLIGMDSNGIYIYQNKDNFTYIPYQKIDKINISKFRSINNVVDMSIYIRGLKQLIFIRIDNINSSTLPKQLQQSHAGNILPKFIEDHCHTMIKANVWQSCYRSIKHWSNKK